MSPGIRVCLYLPADVAKALRAAARRHGVAVSPVVAGLLQCSDLDLAASLVRLTEVVNAMNGKVGEKNDQALSETRAVKRHAL